jgi:O-acetylhomoserine/O-acetylserine sulfhydrylase-like pyridoxal-dependent enzyme
VIHPLRRRRRCPKRINRTGVTPDMIRLSIELEAIDDIRGTSIRRSKVGIAKLGLSGG